MANASKIVASIGLRRAQIYEIDSTGYPDGDQDAADGYDGVRLTGVQSYTPTLPDVQILNHQGDDVVFAQDKLAPTELPSGALNTGKTNLDIDALLGSSLVETLGEAQIGVMATDEQGQEPLVCLVLYRSAQNVDPASAGFGSRHWKQYWFPKTAIIPKDATAEQAGLDQNQYNIVPTKFTMKPWGVPLSDDTNGADQAVYMRTISENPVMMERWTGNGTLTTFNLNWTPINTTKTKVFANGTAQTVASVDTDSTPAFTLSGTPPLNSAVVAFYETSDQI